MKKFFANKILGFTLIELVVSVAIFAFMTAFMVAKYGTFNQSVLLTNLAYDVAVTIRTAQSYGLSVKATDIGGAPNFLLPYGVDFNANNNNQFVMYTASQYDTIKYYNNSISPKDEIVGMPYMIKRGAIISGVCATAAGSCTLSSVGDLSISFLRPDPSANICFNKVCEDSLSHPYTYAEIEIKGTDGSTRVVTVRDNGQISVKQ